MSPRVTDDYKEQKKQQILEAAKRVFVQKGYRGVTMKDIIEESGLSRGGVYLYFSSTEEIFRSLIEASDDNYTSFIEQLSKDTQKAWGGVIQLIQAVIHDIASIEEGLAVAIYEYFLVVRRTEEAQDLLKRRFQRAKASLRILLEKGVETGEFHPVFSIDEISKFLLFVMDGVSINMISLRGEDIDLSAQAAQCILYLQQALQVKDSELSVDTTIEV